jgi:hypothetical protein
MPLAPPEASEVLFNGLEGLRPVLGLNGWESLEILVGHLHLRLSMESIMCRPYRSLHS